VIFLLGTMRPADLIPWILACGDGLVVLEPSELRREVQRIARAALGRYAASGATSGPPDESGSNLPSA
jgi:hypothetical protein